MNPLTTMKISVKNLSIAATLITGLVLTPAIAIADNDGTKRHNKGGGYSSPISHNNSHHKKSYRKEIKRNDHKRIKQHDKRGHMGHMMKKHHKHHDHDYRHNHVHVINQYRSHDHGHSHYYDPRISVGLHLGHFDLYFED